MQNLTQESATKPRRGYGVLSSVASDHVYFPVEGGHIYTSPYIRTELCTPFTAAIFLTACGKDLEVWTGGRTYFTAAAAMRTVPRRITCSGSQLVVAHVNPLHSSYGTLQRVGPKGLFQLDHDAYGSLTDQLTAAFRGELSSAEIGPLFDAIVAITLAQLPTKPQPNPRGEQLIAKLREDPNRSLDRMAQDFGLSYESMSRAFTAAVGISLRRYQQWLKLDNIRYVYQPGKSLTQIAHDAGFSDLAHMTHIFRRTYGAPPSYFLRGTKVKRFAPAHRCARQLT